jgi:hypothetical protein
MNPMAIRADGGVVPYGRPAGFVNAQIYAMPGERIDIINIRRQPILIH